MCELVKMVDKELLLVHSLAVYFIGLFITGFIAPDGVRWSEKSPTTASENPSVSRFFQELIELTKTSGNASQKHKMVLMVVDALRDDFLDRSNDLPFVSNELNSGRACRLKVIVDTPTVTMPRIKSLVTGRSSSFLDIILNLGSSELLEPNLVKTVGTSGVVFYGDDTWLKLLPNLFLRAEGTHSFFVNDFYEVDLNVSRHLEQEKGNSDWTLLILHYLGLDHIGHVEGPRSPLVGPKLQEMDIVVKTLRQNSLDTASGPLVLLTGDHGMHDGGGHGGATTAETTVGLVLLGAPCAPGISTGSWSQIDLAPTMAALLDVEVPDGSVGALVPSLLGPLGPHRALAALFSNTKRLLEKAPGPNQESLFLEGMRLHKNWLKGETDEGALRATELYTTASILMRDKLAASHAPFDIYAMALGSSGTILCALWTLAGLHQKKRCFVPVLRVCVTAAAVIGVHSGACGACSGHSIACSLTFFGLSLQLFAALATAWTLLSFVNLAKNVLFELPQEWQLILFTTIHILSLGSSFCVEEEHLVWYVVWPLVLVVAGIRWPRRWPLIILAVLGHIALSQFNSTGDKWASAPDFEDWLVSRPAIRSCIFASGLLLLLPLVGGGRPLAAILLSVVYLYKAATKSAIVPYYSHLLSENGLVEAWSFYILLGIYLMYRLSRSRVGQKIAAWRDTWLLLAALLRRPHDVLALVYVAFASRLVAACLRGPAAALGVAAAGWAGFYYQGNSNGLASLDVAAGYVGLQSYQPLLVGFQLITHTYSAPVLAVLELATARGSGKWLRVWSGQRLLAASFYLLVTTWLREHLFVWSVFAPKLLYEGAHSLVYLLVVIFLGLNE